ncbi:11683_t:CDS:2 [Funneliformis geosporum]|nr:11683_t:CDS:2 [Funneliformis geosporum]
MEKKLISQAKKNLRDYKIIESFIAGIVLTGNEIKSLRNYQSSINEAYVFPQQQELYIINMHVAAYKYSHAVNLAQNHDTRRRRKLLLKKKEINKIIGQAKAKSYVIIPLKLFFNDREAIKRKKIEQLEKRLQIFTSELEKIRSNRISLELIGGLMVEYQGEKKMIKSLASLRVSPSHELIVRAFDSKLVPLISKVILNNQLGYKVERSTKEEIYFTLLPTTAEIREGLIRNVKMITEEGKKSFRLIHQDIKKSLKEDKGLSQDQKRSYEKQSDKLIKDYQDRLVLAEEKKIQSVPEQFFQAVFEKEMTGEMVGDEDHQQPVLRNVGFTGIAPINNDFFINLNRQLREASDESEVPRDGDGKFTYRVVGVPKIDRDTGNQVWTDEQPYYLEDENGKVIGEATQPDGEITGNFPYYKLLNTSNNTLIKLPQRMEKVLTDSFGIEHEEFEELIKGCVENSDDFADNIHRLQFRGDKNSWPKPSIRETSLAELLNIPEIRDSITGDNNNHQPKLVSIEQIEDFNETLTGLEFSTNYRKFYGKVLGNGLERQRKLQEIDEVLFKKVRNKVNDLKDLKKLVLGDTEEIKNDKEEFNGKEMIKRVELAELMKELLKKEREANPNNNHENDKQGNEQVSELEKAKFIAIQRIRQELTKDPEITEQELEEDKRR